LGERSLQFHRQIGETVEQLGLDQLFVLIDDPQAKAIAQAAGSIPTECLTTPAELIARVGREIQEGDRVLFKASNSVGLNQVVQGVIAELQGLEGTSK
jgi:UDP-N-acetylmuramoyl-tripeptide--D-alanyl-D-alanine ligase